VSVVEPVALGELMRFDHDAVAAAVAMQPGALAELRQHCKVGLLPGVVLGNVMPAHAGYRDALRRTWKAARSSGGRPQLSLHFPSAAEVRPFDREKQAQFVRYWGKPSTA
jgi:hypothetical protein